MRGFSLKHQFGVIEAGFFENSNKNFTTVKLLNILLESKEKHEKGTHSTLCNQTELILRIFLFYTVYQPE